jgi:hypothetical protein
LVSIANGLYCGVSDVAREIWEAAEQPKKISDLVDDLMGIFNIDRASVLRLGYESLLDSSRNVA